MTKQSLCDAHDTAATWRIIIGNQQYFPAAKRLRVLRQPRSVRGTRIGGRNEPFVPKSVYIFFAFANENDAGVQRPGQSVQHLSRMLPIDPATSSVRIPLEKSLWICP